jgi:GTP cyclohydrolase I
VSKAVGKRQHLIVAARFQVQERIARSVQELVARWVRKALDI